MCGIAGIISYDGRAPDATRLDAACDLLRHRGPDDHATWLHSAGDCSIGLAHTRLIVIDPSPAARQPLIDPSGRWVVVFNGAIYNFAELRSELLELGCSFTTASDTEVILHGYATWGADVLQRFNGMWALCLYDTHAQVGLLARDRFGIKPLLYARQGAELTFASELAALVRLSGVSRDLSPASVHHFLRFGYVPHPHSIYRDCRRLPPGYLLRFDCSGPAEPQRYYQLGVDPDLAALDDDQARAELRSRLRRSVHARVVSDVPLGAFLSGGLDSAIVAYHLAEVSPRPPQTFSLGFENQPRYDETRYAQLLAETLGTDHHVVHVGFREVLEHLPVMLDHIGEPFADASLIPTSLLSAHARRHVTVALSGDGADELFGGYYRYLGHRYLRRYLQLPRALRVFLDPLIGALPASKSSRWTNRVRQVQKLLRSRTIDPLASHFMWSRILSPEAEHLLDPVGQMPDFATFQPFVDRLLGESLAQKWAADPLNLILLMDLAYQLPADMLHKVDLASMYHGLEVRVPMLDPDVVQLAASCPSRMKIEGRSRKKMLADAYRDVLPAEILSRPKMGFEMPIGEFLRGDLRDMFLSTVTRQAVADIPPLDYDGVLHLYQDHCERRADHADILYALLVICWWTARSR